MQCRGFVEDGLSPAGIRYIYRKELSMKLNIAPYDWRTIIVVFSASLFLSACAAAPKEVSPSQNTAPSNATTSQSPAGIAVGHDTGASSTTPSASSATVPMQPGGGSGELKWTAPSRWQ